MLTVWIWFEGHSLLIPALSCSKSHAIVLVTHTGNNITITTLKISGIFIIVEKYSLLTVVEKCQNH